MLWEVFMEAVLCKCDWLTYQPLITEHCLQPAPLLSLEVQGGIEKSNPITTLLVLQATSPIQRCLQKSPRSHNKRHRHCAPHLCNSKGFKSPVPEMGTKTTYIFLAINHTITGCKVHISFGMCLELIPPSSKKSTPMVLGGTKFYSQSPKVDRCWRSGQSESLAHSVMDTGPSQANQTQPWDICWNHWERNSLGVSPNQENRNLQACGYDCPYLGKPSLKLMPIQGKAKQRQRARERDKDSNIIWNWIQPDLK